ncbi:MAG: hypothetical protein P1U42_05200 [Phycisphaerales bacterium]|nr:hypothetical protein [Phycisphaerales bacterium]
MMSPKTQTITATTTIALAASIGIALIPTKPGASIPVLAFLAIMLVAWNGTRLLMKRKCPQTDWLNSKQRHEILFSIILASLLMLGSLIATVAKQLELLDGDVIRRIIGINTGLMLIVLGNYLPKNRKAGSNQCCSRSSAFPRFMGWLLFLAGILYSLAWVFFDLNQAGIAIMFVFPVAIAIIIATKLIYSRFAGPKSITEQSA